MTALVDEGREGDVHFDFSKALNSVYFNSLIGKLNYGVGIWPARQTENSQSCWIQGVVISSTEFSWSHWWCTLGPRHNSVEYLHL